MDLSRLKKKVKELKESRSSSSFGEVKKVIQRDLPNIVRVVGEWASVKRAWLECDDGKNRPFDIANDKGHKSILFEAINLVTEKESIFNPQTGKTVKRYKYGDKLGNLVQQLFPAKDVQGWKYSESFVLNCIDRMDNWCSLNKHTKILVKSPSEMGVGGTVIESLNILANSWGDCEGYDINFIKTGVELNTTYSVIPANPESNPQAVQGPLTEEEKKYELYDIDQLTSISNPDYILQHLSVVLSKIDQALGTDFVSRLQKEQTDQAIRQVPADQGQPQTSPPPPVTTIPQPTVDTQPAQTTQVKKRTISFRKKPAKQPAPQPQAPQPQNPPASNPTNVSPDKGYCPICGKSILLDVGCNECNVSLK